MTKRDFQNKKKIGTEIRFCYQTVITKLSFEHRLAKQINFYISNTAVLGWRTCNKCGSA